MTKLKKEEIALVGVAFPKLIDKIAELYEFDKEKYKKACEALNKGTSEFKKYFNELGLCIQKAQINKVWRNKHFASRLAVEFLKDAVEKYKGTEKEDAVVSMLEQVVNDIDNTSKLDLIKNLRFAFKQSGREDLLNFLLPFLEDPTMDFDVALTIGNIFNKTGKEDLVLDALDPFLNSPNGNIRSIAIQAVYELFYNTNSTEPLYILERYLYDEDPLVKYSALWSISYLFERSENFELLEALKPLLNDKDKEIRIMAFNAISTIFSSTANNKVLELLCTYLEDEDPAIRRVVALCVSEIFKDSASILALNAIKKLAKDDDLFVRNYFVKCIADIFENSKEKNVALEEIAKLKEDNEPLVRGGVAKAIGTLFANTNNLEALKILNELAKDNDSDVKRITEDAIKMVKGKI